MFEETFYQSSKDLSDRRYLNEKFVIGRLHDNKKNIYINSSSQNPDLKGQVCKLYVNGHILQIDIKSYLNYSMQSYAATLWIDRKKIEGTFTVRNSDSNSIICTEFHILEINNLEDFVKNNAHFANRDKKRKISLFFEEQQNKLPKVATSELFHKTKMLKISCSAKMT